MPVVRGKPEGKNARQEGRPWPMLVDLPGDICRPARCAATSISDGPVVASGRYERQGPAPRGRAAGGHLRPFDGFATSPTLAPACDETEQAARHYGLVAGVYRLRRRTADHCDFPKRRDGSRSVGRAEIGQGVAPGTDRRGCCVPVRRAPVPSTPAHGGLAPGRCGGVVDKASAILPFPPAGPRFRNPFCSSDHCRQRRDSVSLVCEATTARPTAQSIGACRQFAGGSSLDCPGRPICRC